MSKPNQNPFVTPNDGIPGFSKESFQSLAQAFSEWTNNGNRIQAELARFVSDRFNKDVALISRFAACKDPGEFIALQSEMVTGLTNDYLQEGAKIFALSSEIAKNSLGKLARAPGQP